MKLFYLTALDEQDREKCGILGKIKGQINAFNNMGFEVHFGHFRGTNQFVIEAEDNQYVLSSKNGSTRAKLASIYDKIYSYIKDNSISYLYIRLISLDNKAINFYKKLKKNSVIIIIEFYSHNLELEAKKTVLRNFNRRKYLSALKGTCSLLINKYYFSKLHYCIDLIVTTTEVGYMYGVRTINVVNGIDTGSVSVRNKEKNNYDFNIVSVAMISPWHGYDRVIKGLSEYYKKGGTENILYTVVGEGEEKANLEKMVLELGLQEHVIFTGIKLNSELDLYYNQADIALEMLAGFRRTQGQISSIKMAEYFAKGIPVLYAADQKLYPKEMEQYCYWVENDDSPVDINCIIDFCKDLYNREVDIENNMHLLAKKYFDWSVTMRDLREFMLP